MAYKKCTSKKIAKTDGRTILNKAMPPKWFKVMDLMVINGLDFQAAMHAVGYSDKYYTTDGHKIKKDPRFAKLYVQKRDSLCAKNVDMREKHLESLNSFIADKAISVRDRIGAIKEYASIAGWHSETIRHETTDRQTLLDEASRKEAARLATAMLDTRALPDISMTRRQVQSTIINAIVPCDTLDDLIGDKEDRL